MHNIRYMDLGNAYLNWLKVKIFTIAEQIFHWDDEAQRWGKYLIVASREIININNIKIVIATGAPFHVNYWAAMLKIHCPDIYLIQDLRDTWVQNPFKKYWFGRKQHAVKRMSFALKTGDICTAVTIGLANEYQKIISNCKFKIITNGYDPDDIEPFINEKYIIKKNIFLHIGSISNGRDIACSKFLDEINKIKDIPWQVKLIGNITQKIAIKYNDLIKQKKLIIQNTISYKNALKEVSRCQVALHFGARELSYAHSTKIFEYAGLQKPVLSFNYGGDINSLINDYNLGISVDLSIKNGFYLEKQIRNIINYGLKNNSYKQFSYSNIAYQFDLIFRNV